MTDDTENLVLEHLKRIQAEQSAARERDQEIIARLSHIEIAVARVGATRPATMKNSSPTA